jgi:hypothetical protein
MHTRSFLMLHQMVLFTVVPVALCRTPMRYLNLEVLMVQIHEFNRNTKFTGPDMNKTESLSSEFLVSVV